MLSADERLRCPLQTTFAYDQRLREELSDPTLYFSTLPLDIRRYCLLPLLQGHPTLPPQVFLPAQLVARVQVPPLGKVNDFLLLQNGDLLFIQHRIAVIPDGLVRWNPTTGAILYCLPIKPAWYVKYNINTDTLFLKRTSNPAWVIPSISQLLDEVSVRAAIQDSTSEEGFDHLSWCRGVNLRRVFPNRYLANMCYHAGHLVTFSDLYQEGLLVYRLP